MRNRYKPRYLQLLLTMCCVAGVVNAGSDTTQTKDESDTEQSIAADEINRILALSDDFAYGEYLAGECASCHSVNPVASNSVPVIHGAEPAHLVRALLEYRTGIRLNTTMGLVANGLDDEELAAIVHYLALLTQ